MVDVKPGQVYVPGANSRTARQLLNAAAKAGLNPKTAVRTTEGGFVVPQSIDPAARRSPAAAKPRARRKKSTTPKEG